MEQTGIVDKFIALYKLVEKLHSMGMNEEQIKKFMADSVRKYHVKKARELVQRALDRK